MEFEAYYDAVCARLKAKGYSKLPDEDTVRDDFEAGVPVDLSAEDFEVAWGDPGDEEID